MSKRYTAAGIAITAVYGVGLGYIVFTRWADFQPLKLNELGDFLAGAFGPLAILWLVLGYFQQGIELRQNSEALHLQAQELANSVEQQRELVKVARDQYEADREALDHQLRAMEAEAKRLADAAKPRFRVACGAAHNDNEITHHVNFINYGARCSSLRLTTGSDKYSFSPKVVADLRQDENARFSLKLPRTSAPPDNFDLVILSYVDSQGDAGSETFVADFKQADGGHWMLSLRAI